MLNAVICAYLGRASRVRSRWPGPCAVGRVCRVPPSFLYSEDRKSIAGRTTSLSRLHVVYNRGGRAGPEPWVSGCPVCPVVSGGCPVSVRCAVRCAVRSCPEYCPEYCPVCPFCVRCCPARFGQHHACPCPEVSGNTVRLCPVVSGVSGRVRCVRLCPAVVRLCPAWSGCVRYGEQARIPTRCRDPPPPLHGTPRHPRDPGPGGA